MLLTVSQTIRVAKISQYLSLIDINNSGLYKDGIDENLPRKIYMARKNLEWLYDLDPTDTRLTKVANYTYSLCGKYGLYAQNITGSGGTVSPVTPTTTPSRIDFIVDASSYMPTGATTITIPEFLGLNVLFVRGGIPQSTLTTESTYATWDSSTTILTCSPALADGELISIIPV